MDLIDIIEAKQNKHNLIIAAAGTGKTETLIRLISKKIKNKSIKTTDKVIVFTFTKNAADELLVRLTDSLGSEKSQLNNIFIGTIHGWCNKYLNSSGFLSNTKVLDELERSQLLQRIYPLLNLEDAYDGKNPFVRIDKFERDLDFFYNECLKISNLKIPKKIVSPIQKYISFLEDQRLVDFGYMIRKAIEVIPSDKEDCIYHIFTDEYQDVNPAQVRLIQTIMQFHPGSYLYAVGDPRQSIYQWRGSDIKRILNFNRDFPEAEIYNLNINHRSRPGIIAFANVISHDMDYESSVDIFDMEPSEKRKDAQISVIHSTKKDFHERQIVQCIKKLHSQGVPYSDIAILMRSVLNHSQLIMTLLDQEQIPYFSPNQNKGITFIQDFFFSIFRLMEIMRYHGEFQSQADQDEIEEEIKNCLGNIKQYCDNRSIREIHLAIANWYKKLCTIKKTDLYGHPIYKNEAYNFRQHFFDFCKEINFKIKPEDIEIQEGFSAITQIMRAIEEIYRRRFEGLKNIRTPPIDVFLRNIQWQLNNQIERWTETGMDIEVGNKVTISTVHAAKGLEWPVVFIPFLWEKRFPLRNAGHKTSFPNDMAARYGTTEDDEKRLWYVSVTRARDRVYFFSGKDDKHDPSHFVYSDKIEKCPEYMIETEDILDDINFSKIEKFSKRKYLNIGVSSYLILLECPYHFYMRNIKGINVPVGEELGAGNIIHKIIERTVDGNNEEELIAIIERETYLPLAEYPHQQAIKKSILKKIQKLIDSKILDGIDSAEYKFTIPVQNVIISGIVDATKRTPDGGIEIIDWKYSIHDEFRHRYDNQIQIYAAALRSLGQNVSKGIIYDLSSASISQNSVDISEEKTQQLIENTTLLITKLRENGPITTPNKKSCKICDIKNICPDVC